MPELINDTMSIIDVLPPAEQVTQYDGWWGAGHMLLRGTIPDGVEARVGSLPDGLVPGLLALEWCRLTFSDLSLPRFGARQEDGTRHASLPIGDFDTAVAPSLLFYGCAATEATGLRIALRPGLMHTMDGRKLDGGHVIGLVRGDELVGFEGLDMGEPAWLGCGVGLGSTARFLQGRRPGMSAGNEEWHGTRSGYNSRGCRCVECTEANRLHKRHLRQQRASRPTPDHVHGTANGYSNYLCRCDRCTEAWRITCRGQRARRAAALPEDQEAGE